MTELQAAADGEKSPDKPPPNEVVFTWDEVIAALRLRKRPSGAYESPGGCDVQYVLTDREDITIERGEGLGEWAVVTDPRELVGVSVFKPSISCRRELERGLTRLAASK